MNTPPLAHERNILARVAEALERDGLVGESRLAKLQYLGFTSRVMARPLCSFIKGPASTGKSTVLAKVMKTMPASAYHYITSMSDMALVYNDTVPLKHKMLVVAEAAGMVKDSKGAMILRSLLSEGRICYETVENVNGTMTPRRIEREGPTGLVTTTTKSSVEAELATRMFAASINASPDQTKRVMQSIAQQWARGTAGLVVFDPAPWIELQEWLAAEANHNVVIGFLDYLANAIPPDAARLARDFGAVGTLIGAHALLHQASRGKDGAGNVIATIDDYAVVRELIADIMAEGVGASVAQHVRDVVGAVRALGNNGISVTQLARRMGRHKTTVSDYVEEAIEHGYLMNGTTTRGLAAALTTGDPLPVDREVLPSADAVRQATGV